MSTTTAEALPHKKRALRGRCLVAVDIENVAGGAIVSGFIAGVSRSRVSRVLTVKPGAQVIVGTSHTGLLYAGLAWSGARVVVRSGADGADLALIEVLTGEHVHERFDEVVLVSGDGIFVEAVEKLEGTGVHVTVVADRESCSKRLRLAATRVVWLEPELAEELVAA